MPRVAIVIVVAFLVSVLTSFGTLPVRGQPLAPNQIQSTDRTLNRTTGKGSRIQPAPQQGPVVAPDAPNAAVWSPLSSGVDNDVNAIAVSGSDVYVGGAFVNVCGNITCRHTVSYNHIAKWSAQTGAWSALGNGVNGQVLAFAVDGTDVYVGGEFTALCADATCSSGTAANHIAKWSSATGTWSTLDNGLNNFVYELAANGGAVYAGGEFTQACGNTACSSGNIIVNHIAAWNGSAWSALGNGVNSEVDALVLDGSDLYVGGFFREACGNAGCSANNITVNNIARWSSATQTWSALGSGVNFHIETLAANAGTVFAGGAFTYVCGNLTCDSGNLSVNHLARWSLSNNTWSRVGNGVDDWVYTLAVNANNVYAGGFFSQICGNAGCSSGNITTNAIAKWSIGSSSWSRLDDGVNDRVYALALDNGDVYAGGAFLGVCGNAECDSGNTRVNHIARYGQPAPIATPTSTPTPTQTFTPTHTPTGTVTVTPTTTGASTSTPTNTPDGTPTATPTATPGVSCNAAPPPPTPVAPPNRAARARSRIKLRWNDVECETRYQVRVKDAATGKIKFKANPNANTVWVKTGILPRGRTYKWFVKACNSFGCSKSAIMKFTLQP